MHDSRVLAKEAPASWVDRTIAEVHHGEDVMGEANANLIAAAPDLLEACEAVAATTWSRNTAEKIGEKVRAAIKKARGEK